MRDITLCHPRLQVNGKWYWFNATGIMVTNTWYQYNNA
ncbi:hypothetical protein [Lacrimispora sp.]